MHTLSCHLPSLFTGQTSAHPQVSTLFFKAPESLLQRELLQVLTNWSMGSTGDKRGHQTSRLLLRA